MSIEAFERLVEEKKAAIITAGVREFAKKSFSDASTDVITAGCGISKGLLFHYFGSKRAFYLYCLETALKRLVTKTPLPHASNFYTILFGVLDDKFRLCREYPEETQFVNMASRDACSEVISERRGVFAKYMEVTSAASDEFMARAVAMLPLKNPEDPSAGKALRLYVNTLINRYLILYRETPDVFFQNADVVKAELKRDIDFMLHGICKEVLE